LNNLMVLGIPGGTIFLRLPMVVVNATPSQIKAIAALPAVRSVYINRTLGFFDQESRALIGLDDVAADPALAHPGGALLSGAGTTIAVLDSGVDATHPPRPAQLPVSSTPLRSRGSATPIWSSGTAPRSPPSRRVQGPPAAAGTAASRRGRQSLGCRPATCTSSTSWRGSTTSWTTPHATGYGWSTAPGGARGSSTPTIRSTSPRACSTTPASRSSSPSATTGRRRIR